MLRLRLLRPLCRGCESVGWRAGLSWGLGLRFELAGTTNETGRVVASGCSVWSCRGQALGGCSASEAYSNQEDLRSALLAITLASEIGQRLGVAAPSTESQRNGIGLQGAHAAVSKEQSFNHYELATGHSFLIMKKFQNTYCLLSCGALAEIANDSPLESPFADTNTIPIRRIEAHHVNSYIPSPSEKRRKSGSPKSPPKP